MSLRKRHTEAINADDENSNQDDSGTKLGKENGDENTSSVLLVPSTTKISALDRFLKAYVDFTTSASSQDKGLKLMQYTLWLASRFYGKTSPGRESLHKLSVEICWGRYINRIFGLPASIEEARNCSFDSGAIRALLAWSMVAYYPLEHLAFIKWKAPNLRFPSPWPDDRVAAKATAWSCRFWLLYTVVDIARSTLALREAANKVAERTANSSSSGEDLAAIQKLQRNERLQIIRNLLFTLPGFSWSLPNWDIDPWLSENVVNSLLWTESVVCMYQAISKYKTS
jgi:hypothetical protein